MFEVLIIKNFQSHKRTKIRFTPEINVIAGKSDSGKSSVLRALHWVLYNKPSGDEFRSDWGGDTEVILKLKDGNVIKRHKSDTENYYSLNGEKLKGFGQSIPDEIAKVIPVNDINFQHQLDAPFLLSMKPGPRAKYLDDIVDMQQSYQYVDKAKSKVSALKSDIKNQKANIENLEKKKDKLEGVEELNQYIKNINKFDDSIESYENMTKNLDYHISEIIKNEKILSSYAHFTDPIKKIQILDECTDEIISLQKDINIIDDLIDDIIKITKKQKILCEFSELENWVKRIEDLIFNIKQIDSTLSIIDDMFIEINVIEEELKHNTGEYDKAKQQHDGYIKKLRFCPLCHQRISHAHRRSQLAKE
jgi:exonuclease SbcC